MPLEPLKPTMLPDGAWQQVHADYKGPIGRKYYLHTFIDQYSKYPLVEVCKNTSWDKMEPQLDRVTGLLGNMEVLVTDGGFADERKAKGRASNGWATPKEKAPAVKVRACLPVSAMGACPLASYIPTQKEERTEEEMKPRKPRVSA